MPGSSPGMTIKEDRAHSPQSSAFICVHLGSPPMSDALKPTTPAEVVDAVAQAVADEAPLEIVGQGSKRGLGRPVQAARQPPRSPTQPLPSGSARPLPTSMWSPTRSSCARAAPSVI